MPYLVGRDSEQQRARRRLVVRAGRKLRLHQSVDGAGERARLQHHPLSALQLGRCHHLHGLGDLRGRKDRLHPHTDRLNGRHGAPACDAVGHTIRDAGPPS
eukprot:scaffold69088_cov60-Phaeocystis_antarctica.AAC.6